MDITLSTHLPPMDSTVMNTCIVSFFITAICFYWSACFCQRWRWYLCIFQLWNYKRNTLRWRKNLIYFLSSIPYTLNFGSIHTSLINLLNVTFRSFSDKSCFYLKFLYISNRVFFVCTLRTNEILLLDFLAWTKNITMLNSFSDSFYVENHCLDINVYIKWNKSDDYH